MDISVLTEEYVQRNAVNASALANARKISSKGDFTGRKITADRTLIYGDCKGSGKEPYHTSVDVSGDSVISRCSCPSRQFPCKHALALMLDFASGRTFETGDVPEDIARKREKIEKREEKAKQEASADVSPKSEEELQKEAQKKKASADSAAKKKIARQMEGLSLVSDFTNEMLSAGLGTVNSGSVSKYKDLTKQLGDYYLNGLQLLLQRFILAVQADKSQSGEKELVEKLVQLDQAAKKCRAWLEKQLESGDFGPKDDILYEQLGGIWRLDQLEELGLYKENSELVQLSFTVLWDEAAQTETDTAYWIDLTGGVISKTENIRPVKAKKYVHADDSAFELYKVKKLYFYPGGINRRIRWEEAVSEPCGPEIPGKVLSFARDGINASVKEAKNELKNTLSDESVAMLIAFDCITVSQEGVMALRKGEESIELRESSEYEGCLKTLRHLPERYCKEGAVLGEIRYSAEDKKVYMVPLAVVTRSAILRLI
ncbi:SWIM zinc finger protein [Ruminococcaceae bacterium R-25]|nr:SWIM zinc finger protein [Ruminococcaceae bacterium R-25]SUQ22547.1 SWIM zinc finger [Oscillospiraceae bacterium]